MHVVTTANQRLVIELFDNTNVRFLCISAFLCEMVEKFSFSQRFSLNSVTFRVIKPNRKYRSKGEIQEYFELRWKLGEGERKRKRR